MTKPVEGGAVSQFIMANVEKELVAAQDALFELSAAVMGNDPLAALAASRKINARVGLSVRIVTLLRAGRLSEADSLIMDANAERAKGRA